MRYHIDYYLNGSLTGTETQIDMSLAMAKQQAINAVEVGIADKVEVRDVEQKLVFQFPRVLHGAKSAD